MNFDPVVIGKALRKKRIEMEIGVRQIAKEVGVSPGYITQLEKGMIKKPSTTIISPLLTILKMENSHISEETEEKLYKDKLLQIISEMNLAELREFDFITKYPLLVRKLYEINQKSNKREKILGGISDYIDYQHNRYVTRRLEVLFEEE